MNLLSSLRDKIDQLDRDIMNLLNQRAALVLQVAEAKKSESDLPQYYRPEREAEIIKTLLQQYEGLLSHESIRHIFREIISACRALEHQHRIAYLGPVGTFSYEAAKQQFGLSETLLPKQSFEAVFDSVKKGEADYAVVPIENSTTGKIPETNRLLSEGELQVIAELALPVRFCLLSRCESMDDIKKLFLHPQAKLQCQQWLTKHLSNVEQVMVSSNGEAARLAGETLKSAALAGSKAAEQFGLAVLAHDVQDRKDNETRFVVLQNGQY